jgi:hypothetical protein
MLFGNLLNDAIHLKSDLFHICQQQLDLGEFLAWIVVFPALRGFKLVLIQI